MNYEIVETPRGDFELKMRDSEGEQETVVAITFMNAFKTNTQAREDARPYVLSVLETMKNILAVHAMAEKDLKKGFV